MSDISENPEANAIEDSGILSTAKHLPNVPVAPAHGIAAIALEMALKYHNITTVQDGVLYQQYKVEGKNMSPLHLDIVFETAIRIEAHLMAAPGRISEFVQQVAIEIIEDAVTKNEEDDPSTAAKDEQP